MSKNALALALVLIGLGVNTTVQAKSALEVLNLREALKLAHHQSPKMIEARGSIVTARGELFTASVFESPEIEFELGNQKSFEIHQPLDALGVNFLKAGIASANVSIQKEVLKSTWAVVYRDVRIAYYETILHKKELQLAEDNLEAVRRFFGQVQMKYETGQAFKNDLQRAKIELLKAESATLEAQKNLRTHKAQLNMALGRPMTTEFDIQESLHEEQFSFSFDVLKDMMMANQPDIKIADLELDVRRKALVREQLNRLPSYRIGFKQENTGDGDESSFLLGIKIPLWGLNQGEVHKARAERDMQHTRVLAAKESAIFALYSAYLTAELHQKQLRLHKTSLLESAELLRLANVRYGEGRIDFLNYLEQVKAATEARVNYFRSLSELGASISLLEIMTYVSLRQEDFFDETF